MSLRTRITLEKEPYDWGALMARFAQALVPDQLELAPDPPNRAGCGVQSLAGQAETFAQTCHPLTLQDLTALLPAAQLCGFRPVDRPIDAQDSAPLIVLERPDTPPLQLGTDPIDGRVVALTPPQVVKEVIQRHVLEQTRDHLQSQGMAVQVQQRANGEIQLTAKDQSGPGPSTPTTLKAAIDTDGRLDVDVDGIKGKACEPMVQDLAQAIGGQIVTSVRKRAYFETPIHTQPRKKQHA